MNRISEQDRNDGSWRPLWAARRGQPNYRELAELRARREAPPIELEPVPDVPPGSARDALYALTLLAIVMLVALVRCAVG